MIEPLPINFNYYKQKSGHPNWKAIHEEAVALARQIEPLIHKDADDTIVDKAADALRKAKSLATAANNFRINKARWKSGYHALRPMYFIWTMHYTCNFRCTYCDDHRGNHYYDLEDKPLGFDDRMRMLKTMRTGTAAIYFCGGEPSIVPDLPVFTDACFNMGYHPLMINSNGFQFHQLLKKPEWYKWLRHMDIIIISLDGLDIDRLRDMWGVKRVEQVLVNLLMLRELRQVVDFKLIVNTVIDKDTVEMASDTMDFINDLGDVWYVPVPINYHGDKNNFAFERDMIVREDYKQFAAKLMERKRSGNLLIGSERILDMLLNVRPYHCLPTLRPHVDPDGRIAWPCRAPKNVDEVYVNVLDYKNLDDCWEAANAKMKAAGFHGTGPNQCGDMCAWMQNYTTARYHDFLTDPFGSGIFGEVADFVFKSK